MIHIWPTKRLVAIGRALSEKPACSACSGPAPRFDRTNSVTMWERRRQVAMPEGRPKMTVKRNDKKDRLRIMNGHLGVVSSARGFVVTVGPVSVLLDREAAEELTCLLVDALEPTDPPDVSPT